MVYGGMEKSKDLVLILGLVVFSMWEAGEET